MCRHDFSNGALRFLGQVLPLLSWPPFAVSQALMELFVLLHYPFVFLAAHLFHSPGFEVFNGRLVLTNGVVLLVVLLQGTLWTFIFLGLLRLCERVKLAFRRNDPKKGRAA